MTALHLATKHENRFSCLEYLLERGLDINDSGRDFDTTPLGVAAFFGTKLAIEKLTCYGAMVDPEVRASSRPLYLAAQGGHEDTALKYYNIDLR